MVSTRRKPFCFWQRARFWEGEREITYWCMSGELTLCFFFFFLSFFLCFRFSSYLSFLFFFLVFYFVIPLRWLLLWYLHHFLFFSPFCTRQRPPFITPVMARFYCFSPLLPFSDLGVLVVWVYLSTTTRPFVCHSPSPNKEDYFVC